MVIDDQKTTSTGFEVPKTADFFWQKASNFCAHRRVLHDHQKSDNYRFAKNGSECSMLMLWELYKFTKPKGAFLTEKFQKLNGTKNGKNMSIWVASGFIIPQC